MYSCWAPSGRYLLVHASRCADEEGVEIPGILAIADVETGRLAAQSTFTAAFKWRHERRYSMGWHPDPQGIVMEDDINIHDLAQLAEAGFATGMLPAAARMHHAGFSADARHLVAIGGNGIMLVECRVARPEICLVACPLLHDRETLGSTDVIGWLPGTSMLCLQRYTAAIPHIQLLDLGAEGQAQAQGLSCGPDHVRAGAFAPSGKLYFTDIWRRRSWQIADVQSSQMCWDLADNGSWGSDLMKLQGMENSVQESVGCWAWMPTGLGVVVSTFGENCPEVQESFMPPAVHLLWFA